MGRTYQALTARQTQVGRPGAEQSSTQSSRLAAASFSGTLQHRFERSATPVMLRDEARVGARYGWCACPVQIAPSTRGGVPWWWWHPSYGPFVLIRLGEAGGGQGVIRGEIG